MLLIKYLLLAAGGGLLAGAWGVLIRDGHRWLERWRAPARGSPAEPVVIDWRTPARLTALAAVPLLLGASIVVVPAGRAGVRVSQVSGTRPGTLYPGVHFLKPFVESVAAVLKDNPLLIQKIVAERLSDKMQIMMVPMDGRYFFANDVFRGGPLGSGAAEPEATKAASRPADHRP